MNGSRRRQVDGVVGSQPMCFREAGGIANERIHHLYDEVAGPVGIETSNDSPVLYG